MEGDKNVFQQTPSAGGLELGHHMNMRHWTKKAALSPLAKESLFPAVLNLALDMGLAAPYQQAGATSQSIMDTHNPISLPAFICPPLAPSACFLP